MKFEDDDLKDGKLWAALQKEIDRDLAEKESGETLQEELADIEDSIEFESKETKSEDHIPDETANLSNLRSVLEATERAKDEEAKQKMKQTKVEPVTQDIEIPEFTEEEEEIEETPAETKTESEPEEVMVDDDLIHSQMRMICWEKRRQRPRVRRKKCLVIRWKPQWSASSATR